MPRSARSRAEFIKTMAPDAMPSNTFTWCSSVGSWMISASGCITGSRVLIGCSLIRQNATTGAPVRSEPKLGNACACQPSAKAAAASSSAAVTTP